MKYNLWLSISTILLLLAIPITACLGALFVLDSATSQFDSEYATSFSSAEWRPLPKPPEDVQKLAAAGPFIVYIQTMSGKYLGCSRPSKYDVNCWYEVTEPPAFNFQLCEENSNSDRWAKLPDDTVSYIRIEHCASATGDYTRSAFSYALKSDGNIWQWGFDRHSLAETPNRWKNIRNTIWGSLLAGCLIGVAIPLFGLIFVWKAKGPSIP